MEKLDNSPEIDYESEPPAALEAEGETEADPKERNWGRLALMISVPLLLLAAGVYYYVSSLGTVSTDNAYVHQDKVSVSAEVSGKIVEVLVQEGQSVKKGDVLFIVDPEPYELALRQANADIAAAKRNIGEKRAEVTNNSVDIGAAREDIAFAEANFQRQSALMKRGFTTKASYDAAKHAVSQAREQLKQAQAKTASAKASLSDGGAGEDPDLAAAQVRREKALLDLSRTKVVAPMSGRIAETDRLQIGQMMVSGVPVVTIVDDDSTWIEANFKETELDQMRAGQDAHLEFDAYPNVDLKGHVVSIGAGTGSEFSVLPAQNATGNWVKVTQRVPVRIELNEPSPRPLIAGMSVDVSVDLE